MALSATSAIKPQPILDGKEPMDLLNVLLGFVSSLVWPAVAVFALIQFQKPISHLFTRLRSADLPGGISLDFDERLQEARAIAEDISSNPDAKPVEHEDVPLSDANRRLLDRGLRPSPSGLDFSTYKKMVANDPVLALAGLRTEVEAMALNLADGFGVDADGLSTPNQILTKLMSEGAIYSRQYNLGKRVIELCNSAIHGVPVSKMEAEAVIDIATVLASEYVDWLGWGFPNGPDS